MSDLSDVPDHVLLIPTVISPEEQPKDIRCVDANRTKVTQDDSTGDYHITVRKLPMF